MGLLARSFACTLAASPLVACYAPEVRDCTLACSSADECADGQVCGDDRFCARPELAGRCFMRTDRDAGPVDGATDAPVAPADAAIAVPPDAPTRGMLSIEIAGQGRVDARGIGTCDSAPPQNGKCTFVVTLERTVTVDAFAKLGWRFDKWTTNACSDAKVSTCSFQSSAAVQVGVKFRRWLDDDDD